MRALQRASSGPPSSGLHLQRLLACDRLALFRGGVAAGGVGRWNVTASLEVVGVTLYVACVGLRRQSSWTPLDVSGLLRNIAAATVGRPKPEEYSGPLLGRRYSDGYDGKRKPTLLSASAPSLWAPLNVSPRSTATRCSAGCSRRAATTGEGSCSFQRPVILDAAGRHRPAEEHCRATVGRPKPKSTAAMCSAGGTRTATTASKSLCSSQRPASHFGRR